MHTKYSYLCILRVVFFCERIIAYGNATRKYILENQSVSELDLPTFSNGEGTKKKVLKIII